MYTGGIQSESESQRIRTEKESIVKSVVLKDVHLFANRVLRHRPLPLS